MKAFKCDGCGNYATYEPTRIARYSGDFISVVNHVDLCDECYMKLHSIMPNAFTFSKGDEND